MRKVALVLSGGGARGMAHIGVIEELEKQGYEISSIAGTSMGALIGAVYAIGKMQKLKEWFYTLDKRKVFSLVDFTFSTHGLVKGDKVLNTLKEFIEDKNIENLNIPFSATATDLLNKKEVVFTTGSIYEAIRASIAIPMVITPVKKDNTLLLDGGVINNIPIKNVIRTDGDALVVVNVNAHIPVLTLPGSKKEKEEKHSKYQLKLKGFQQHLKKITPKTHKEDIGPIHLIEKTISLMMFQMSQQTLKEYNPDLLINISRDTCTTFDFFLAEELVEIGRLATRNVLDKAE